MVADFGTCGAALTLWDGTLASSIDDVLAADAEARRYVTAELLKKVLV